MNVRWLSVWWVVVGLGCAHGPRAPKPQQPVYEHVFQKPLSEAMDATRELLAAKGYTFEDSKDPGQLVTKWQEPGYGFHGNVSYTRYLVTGIAVSPRQSVVRIFRMSAETVGNDVSVSTPWLNWLREANYHTDDPRRLQAAQLGEGAANQEQMRGENMRGTRDLELEKALTLRLESAPSIEVVSGNVRQDPLPTPVRDADFYLARWKDGDEEQGLCGESVRGLPALLSPGLTLLIGEQLGTREAPRVVGHVVCQAARAGLPVVLGLSIPGTEQERIDTYLASPGAPADQDALLDGRFWQRPYQDGRSSRAIFDLIDRVRAMRAEGMQVSLMAYDTDTARASERDAEQARVWLERRKAHPHEFHVVLAGNTHTRTLKGVEWDPGFTPMAHHLRSGRLVVLEMSYAQGTRWGCDLDRAGKLACGLVGSTPSGKVAAMPGQSPFIRRVEDEDEGFHGLLYVGAITPSLPAISQQKEAPPPVRAPPSRPLVRPMPRF